MITTTYDNGEAIVTHDSAYDFIDGFNRRTGVQITMGKNDVDPFMRSFPSVLDVGVMGFCEHGNLGLCTAAGVSCYQSGLTKAESHMSLTNFMRIVDEAKSKTFQIALGGRGDPNKHPDFGAMLSYARINGVVPNYTTSGLKLTAEEIELTRQYCGAVAVSWYRSSYTLSAISAFLAAGCTTNIQYVLGNNSIDEAIRRLGDNSFPNVNAVIFLLHKPVGQGQFNNVLSNDDPRLKEFFALVEYSHPFKIGFDSCSIPGLLSNTTDIDPNSIDTCEGARFSAYISPSMVMTPCSFDQSFSYGVSLNNTTIKDAWNSLAFNAFRSHLFNACPSCPKRRACYGGCPLTPQIVLCDYKE